MCVVLSKQDQALVLSRQEIEFVMHLSDLERVRDGRFRVFELTSIPVSRSKNNESIRDSVEELLEQLIDFKCISLGVTPPNRANLQNQAASGGLFVTQDAAHAASNLLA